MKQKYLGWLFLLTCLSGFPLKVEGQQKEWRIQKIVNGGIVCIACLDEQRCVVGGQEVMYDDTYIMKTVDGGKTWKKVYADTGVYPKRALQISNLAWISPDVIIASADSSYIIRSIDGGKTWGKTRVYDGFAYAKPMYFCDSLYGVLFEAKSVPNEEFNRPMVTSDGGATWKSIPGPKEPIEWNQTLISRGACIAPMKFFGFGGRGDSIMISRTKDYGKTWDQKINPFVLPNGLQGYGKFFFLDSLNGWFSLPEAFDKKLQGYPMLIARTNDGGENWTVVFQDTLPMKLFGFQSMIFTDLLHGIGTTEGRICRTTDAGASWSVDSFLLHEGSTTYIAMRKQEPSIIASGVGLIAYVNKVSHAEQELPISGDIGELVVKTMGEYLEVEFTSERGEAAHVWCDDVQGRRVIAERTMEGGVGKRIIRFDSGGLPSGTYFITVEQGGERRTEGVQITR
ncbi:MAG: hypothetical protein IT211_05140 [Armatimonadetes bacterium]|nr:hypothetical protein [Armatimonadota bacterium]